MASAIIKASLAALRQSPRSLAERSDEVLHGMRVEILEAVSTQWRRVCTYYRYEGYLPLQALQTGEAAQRWAVCAKYAVRKSYCDVLCAPDVKSCRLLSLPRGALVRPLGAPDGNGWRKICLADGREGYIRERYLAPEATSWRQEEEAVLRRALVRTALSYLGTAYRWGGKTPLGIDCSGLCSMSYLLNGVIIYRDAKLMPGFPLHEIPAAEAKPGDLILFPGHEAMYLGNGRFVHATAHTGSDGVVLSSFDPRRPDYRADLAEQILCFASIF